MTYGKLENGRLIRYRQPIRTDEKDIFTTDPEVLAGYGWIPVIHTQAPEQEGFYAVPHWEEQDGTIIQVWELLPVPDAEEETLTHAELTAKVTALEEELSAAKILLGVE